MLVTMVLDSRGVYVALARSESSCLGLKDKRSDVEAMLGGDALWLLWTYAAAQLADCIPKGFGFELLQRRNCAGEWSMSGLSFQLMKAHRTVITSWIMCFQPRMKHGIIPDWTNEDAKRMGRCQRLATVSRQLWCARMRQYWHNVSINCFFFHLIADVACMSLLSVMDEDVERARLSCSWHMSVRLLTCRWCFLVSACCDRSQESWNVCPDKLENKADVT